MAQRVVGAGRVEILVGGRAIDDVRTGTTGAEIKIGDDAVARARGGLTECDAVARRGGAAVEQA